jgi:hypothetical protein
MTCSGADTEMADEKLFLGPSVHCSIGEDGQLCMTGEQLARHHVQQAQLAAAFLPGGEHHGSVMAPIVQQLYLTEADAADAVRTSLEAALEALSAAADSQDDFSVQCVDAA